MNIITFCRCSLPRRDLPVLTSYNQYSTTLISMLRNVFPLTGIIRLSGWVNRLVKFQYLRIYANIQAFSYILCVTDFNQEMITSSPLLDQILEISSDCWLSYTKDAIFGQDKWMKGMITICDSGIRIQENT